MARRPFPLTNLPVAALGVAAAALGAAVTTLGNGDAVVERGFKRALASMAADTGTVRTAGVTQGEQLLLSRVLHDPGVNFTKPVAIGDRITIQSGGRDRVLSVVKVDRLDGSVIPISSERPTQLLLVTCRDESSPEKRPIRFLIEADEPLPALSSAKAARTL